MRRTLCWVAAGIGLLATPTSAFAGLIGLQFLTGNLYAIDEETGTATPYDSLQSPYFGAHSGLAYLDGRLYVTNIFEPPFSGVPASFGTIDLANGSFTPVNQQGGSRNLHGLAADPVNRVLYSIDQDNGNMLLALTPDGLISPIAQAGLQGRALAFNTADRFLYSSEDRLDADGVIRQHLSRIDPATAATTDVAC